MLIVSSKSILDKRVSSSRLAKMLPENETIHNLNKDHCECLIILATKESYLYQQIDSVTMGFPLGFISPGHPKMKFTFKKEQNKCFNFKVVGENNVFTTSVYRKLTFSGVYTHFDSYMLVIYNFSLILTTIFCSFTICSDMPKFHQ